MTETQREIRNSKIRKEYKEILLKNKNRMTEAKQKLSEKYNLSLMQIHSIVNPKIK